MWPILWDNLCCTLFKNIFQFESTLWIPINTYSLTFMRYFERIHLQKSVVFMKRNKSCISNSSHATMNEKFQFTLCSIIWCYCQFLFANEFFNSIFKLWNLKITVRKTFLYSFKSSIHATIVTALNMNCNSIITLRHKFHINMGFQILCSYNTEFSSHDFFSVWHLIYGIKDKGYHTLISL